MAIVSHANTHASTLFTFVMFFTPFAMLLLLEFITLSRTDPYNRDKWVDYSQSLHSYDEFIPKVWKLGKFSSCKRIYMTEFWSRMKNNGWRWKYLLFTECSAWKLRMCSLYFEENEKHFFPVKLGHPILSQTTWMTQKKIQPYHFFTNALLSIVHFTVGVRRTRSVNSVYNSLPTHNIVYVWREQP